MIDYGKTEWYLFYLNILLPPFISMSLEIVRKIEGQYIFQQFVIGNKGLDIYLKIFHVIFRAKLFNK